jgi:hypothetical protein
MPGYENYNRVVVERLNPLIEGKYRTLAGPTNTAVMGSSLGGVVSFYLGWQWSEVREGCVPIDYIHVSGQSARPRFLRTKAKTSDLSR